MKANRWVLGAVLVGTTLALSPAAARSFAPPAATTGPSAVTASAATTAPASTARAAASALAPAHAGTGRLAGPGSNGPGPGSNGLCEPGTPPAAPETTSPHLGNPLLGPALLPITLPVGPLLAGYQRLGGLTAPRFLRQYGNADQSAYEYPPADGFELDPAGVPIKAAQQLLPGYRLDRFGFPGGRFLAPLGTPLRARSLPPSNLNTPVAAPLANYHVYCVVKPFTVDAGPIAPWFAQPGRGTQFKLNPAYLPQAGTALDITWLLGNGYLVEEDLTPDEIVCLGDAQPAGVGVC